MHASPQYTTIITNTGAGRMDVQRMDGWADIPSCFSPGYHLGGDEFDYYCGLKGLQGYCKSVGAKQG